MSINPGVGKNLACCPSTMYITNNNEYISPEDDDGEAKVINNNFHLYYIK